MPRVTINQTNFTAGEISPKCYGRVDVTRYQNGAAAMPNCVVNIHGGAERRPGSTFIAETKDSSKRSRLVPYIFSTTQAYMLEFGHLYMRVYVQSGGQVLKGGVPYEIETPYTEDMLAEMDYTQGADTMFIFHRGAPIHILQRIAADLWVLGPAPITVAPFDEIGHIFPVVLTLSATTVGEGRTAAVPSATFLPADIGRRVAHLSGSALITGVTSSTSVTVTIQNAFSVAAIPANAWELLDSPQAALMPSAKDPVGAVITLTATTAEAVPELGPEKPITGITIDEYSTVTVTAPGHGLSSGGAVLMAGCVPVQYNGTRVVTVMDPDNFTFSLTNPGPAVTLGTTQTTTSTAQPVQAFRAADVGKYVRLNSGLCLITAFSSAETVSATIKTELSAVVASPPGAWSIESSVWNAKNGYPGTGSLYEQRLTVAGSTQYPQTVWGSRSSLFYDFTIGVNADDAFSFSLPSTGQINPIQRMVSAKALMPLTYGGEYTMGGGGDEPLTPTNVKAPSPSVYGCNNVKPLRVGNEVLFVQRAGRKIRSLAYRIESDTYNAPDLTVLAEHITASGITDMTYQQEPYSRLWCVRADGKLATLTLDRDEGVTAWCPQHTDGLYESCASVPNPTGDEVWCIVQRTIGGQVKRYVERFEPTYYTDSGIVGTDEEGTAVWGGIGHLEGKSVAVRADGVYLGMFTVTGGEVEISRNAFDVQIGLPFTNSVTLLRPEIQAGDGTIQGNAQRVHEVSVLLMETVGCKINEEELAFREFGEDVLDFAPDLFSGFKRGGLTEWSRGNETITIKQDMPYPFHLLAVVRKLTVNS